MRLDEQLFKIGLLEPEQRRRKHGKWGRLGGHRAPSGTAPRRQRASWGVYACAAHAFVLLDDTKAAGTVRKPAEAASLREDALAHRGLATCARARAPDVTSKVP